MDGAEVAAEAGSGAVATSRPATTSETSPSGDPAATTPAVAVAGGKSADDIGADAAETSEGVPDDGGTEMVEGVPEDGVA